MSQIILQTLDFSSIGFPSVGEFYLGVDIDGIPKLKRSSDTLSLYATSSGYAQYITTNVSDFIDLVKNNSLQPGSVYVLNDYQTQHYIQYTDSSGDGTSFDEIVNTGNPETIVVVAISNNEYNKDVKSLNYPEDIITWRHDLQDRELEYYNPFGTGKGFITYRKSKNGNSRDYDFRNVVFYRWNDGFGNYTIFRKFDAPNIFDYKICKAFEEGYVDPFFKNEIGSFKTLNNGFPYYLDNLIISTYSSAKLNNISVAHGVTIDSSTFSLNEFSFLSDVSFVGQNDISFNKIGEINQTDILGDFNFNESRLINSSTISYIFTVNRISEILDSVIGTSQGNSISKINQSNLNNISNNTGFLIENSNVDTFQGNNFNRFVNNTITQFEKNDINKIENNIIDIVVGNVVNTISGNTCSQVSDNISATIRDNIAQDISNNNIDEIYDNTITSDISYNTGTSIYLNTGTISISTNQSNKIYSNTGTGLILFNKSNEIFNNTLNNSDLNTNISMLISSNTLNGNLFSNISQRIIGNTISNSFSFNNVTDVQNNILGTFSYNSGTELNNNSLTQSQYNSFISLTNKDIDSFNYQINYATVSIDSSVNEFLVWNPITGNVSYRELPDFIIRDVATSSISATLSTKTSEYFGVSYSSTTYFNLPSLSSVTDGKVFLIKDESGLASINPIVIQAGTSSIDGSTQSILAVNYGSLTILKKSNGWWII